MNTPNLATPFSAEEIEKMRSIVLSHDHKNTSQNVFDPNNPPKIKYTHQEFPKLVYRHETSKPSREKVVMRQGAEHVDHIPAVYDSLTVRSAEELKAALANGYQEDPPALGLEHQGLNYEEPVEEIEDEDDEEKAATAKVKAEKAKAKGAKARTRKPAPAVAEGVAS